MDALRHSLGAVRAVLNAEAEEGDATALGLAPELAKPKFIITHYFLSDVLDTLGALSKAFKKSDLNLLHIEQLVVTHIATLQELKYQGLATRVVTELTDYLHNKYHHVFFDNFLTQLEKNGVYGCGTARKKQEIVSNRALKCQAKEKID